MRFALMTGRYVEWNHHLNSCLPPTGVFFDFGQTLHVTASLIRFRFDTSSTAGWSCPIGVAPTSGCTTRAYQLYVIEDDVGTNCCIMANIRAEAEAVWKRKHPSRQQSCPQLSRVLLQSTFLIKQKCNIIFAMKSGWILSNTTPAFSFLNGWPFFVSRISKCINNLSSDGRKHVPTNMVCL